MAWGDDTYAAYDKFNNARSDFMDATTPTKLREAWERGNSDEVIAAWDDLGTAVGDFFDHLVDARSPAPCHTGPLGGLYCQACNGSPHPNDVDRVDDGEARHGGVG